MELNDNRRPALGSLRAVDTARGVVITVIAGIVGYFGFAPTAKLGQGELSISPSGLTMLLIGMTLQLTILFGRPLIDRFERARGLEGQVAPIALQVCQLLADGLTVLLCALAVFGGITRFVDGI